MFSLAKVERFVNKGSLCYITSRFILNSIRNQSGVLNDEKNIPASEQEKKEQARFPAENVDKKRSQGSCFKKSQRAPLSFRKQRYGYGWTVACRQQVSGVSNQLKTMCIMR